MHYTLKICEIKFLNIVHVSFYDFLYRQVGSVVSRSRPGTYNLMPGHQRDVLNPRRTLALIKTNHRQQPQKNAREKGEIAEGITLKLFLCHFSTVFPRRRPLLAGESFVAHFPRICHALTL